MSARWALSKRQDRAERRDSRIPARPARRSPNKGAQADREQEFGLAASTPRSGLEISSSAASAFDLSVFASLWCHLAKRLGRLVAGPERDLRDPSQAAKQLHWGRKRKSRLSVRSKGGLTHGRVPANGGPPEV